MRIQKILTRLLIVWVWLLVCPALTIGQNASTFVPYSSDELQKRTFHYFWDLVDNQSQVPDRWPTLNFSSIAATGFGLSAYIIGAERRWITRKEAAERVARTLQVLYDLPQGSQASGVAGYKGFYYHFLDHQNALRFKTTELSSIDTGLLMAGILSCMTYFDSNDPLERKIRELTEALYRRVEWDWMLNENNRLSMGWHPEKGFIQAEWYGYNEAMILYIMAMASPTHPIPAASWDAWCDPYYWADYKGQEHINFGPLFGHQYSHVWIDFKGIYDKYTKEKGIDYFENSRRATLANRAYCIDNPKSFKGHSADIWGLTACDGPMDWAYKNDIRKSCYYTWNSSFQGYSARGIAIDYLVDDGTITPTAAGGSFPFAPNEAEHTLQYMWNTLQDSLVGTYGFKDAFNLSFDACGKLPAGWFNKDYLGIDQGPILLMIENHKSGLLWNIMKKNPYIIDGLKKAGFEGGWLTESNTKEKQVKVIANPDVHADPTALFSRNIFTSKSESKLPYRLKSPSQLIRNEKYPLTIFLHGSGERGTDNNAQLKNGVLSFIEPHGGPEINGFLLVPQCPLNDRWSEMDYTKPAKFQESPTKAMQALMELIDIILLDHPEIDRDRIYLCGLSMGASGLYDLLSRKPDLFAAAIPVCGAADIEKVNDWKHIPVWVFHGRLDDVVPVHFSRNVHSKLRSLNVDTNYTEYKTLRHDCWDQAFYQPETLQWLFRQQKNLTQTEQNHKK
ncbi:MAG: hypothetical protein IPI60_20375 [Saprospiraceae bacterium]|nr:hypothetical protein [Saprospiraceae bacterium]